MIYFLLGSDGGGGGDGERSFHLMRSRAHSPPGNLLLGRRRWPRVGEEIRHLTHLHGGAKHMCEWPSERPRGRRCLTFVCRTLHSFNNRIIIILRNGFDGTQEDDVRPRQRSRECLTRRDRSVHTWAPSEDICIRPSAGCVRFLINNNLFSGRKFRPDRAVLY